MREVGCIVTATISWFVKNGDGIARAEEKLVSIDEKSVTFTRDNLKYQLVSEYPLGPFLHGDVLFMRQEKGGKLLPFNLPETLSREEVMLIGEKSELTPSQLKELVTQRTEKLKRKLLDYEDLIRFLVKLRAEKDIKSLDFIKDLQKFQDSLYGEFLKTIEQNIGDIALSKKTIQELLPKNQTPLAQPPVTAQTPAITQPMGIGGIVSPAFVSPPPIGVSPTPSPLILGPAPSAPTIPLNATATPSTPLAPQTSSPPKTTDDKIRSLFQ